jgi:hypothetical protein
LSQPRKLRPAPKSAVRPILDHKRRSDAARRGAEKRRERNAATEAADEESPLLSRQRAAHKLGDVNLRTVDRLIRRGKIRGVKIGSRMMIVDDSIDTLIAGGGEP